MSDANPISSKAIAIVGLSGRFPGAHSLEEFWQNVRAGADTLATFSPEMLKAAGVDAATQALPGWVPRGTVLQDADMFDAGFFGYSPREAQIIDPQQRLFLECAWEAMENAGYAGELAGTTVGIYAGASMNSYVISHLLANRALLSSVGGYQVMLGNDKDFLTTRASYKLNLHGPSMAVQTACSTSLVAVQVACQALLHHECDMAIAGGVSVSFPQGTGYQYQEGMIFSPDGVCRPFDAEARGTRAGAGAGIVVLKRLTDALADRDTIQAVILAAAINNDGAGKAGYTAPSIDGQMEVIATAHALAGIDARSISYVEAHGTATPLGDPIEFAALTRVFRAATSDTNFCALGSLKANLGHLDAAAGVAGLIKTVLALRHGEIPPLAHFKSPNPQLQIETSPFRVPTVPETWNGEHAPRRAGVSSFGIGGTNAHVILEEAPVHVAGVAVRKRHLFVQSARSQNALDAATENLVAHLRAHHGDSTADVAHTLQVGRRAFVHRRAVVVGDNEEAMRLLSNPEQLPVVNGAHEGAARSVAFLFGGQGSQHAGMCAELYRTEAVFRAEVDRCAELIAPYFGHDLRALLASGTDEVLSATDIAQPILFVTEYALAMLWKSWGVEPESMMGHSIGEYVAAHLAGVFTLEDALRVVVERGRLMQSMPAGDMLAVSLGPVELKPFLQDGPQIAAINGPALCTVSGTKQAIAGLASTLETAGIECRRLHTSHAFHSDMMDGAMEPFRAILNSMSLSAPTVPFVSNVTGKWIRAEEAMSSDYWVRHLRNAVRFADGIATLTANSSVLLLEVGAGNVLTTLARQSLPRAASTRAVASLPHPRETRGDTDTMLNAAARLWVAGVDIDWVRMHADEQQRRIPLPSYPFERKRHWVEPEKTDGNAPGSYRLDDVSDWFYAPTWARKVAPQTLMKKLSGTWLVFGRDDALQEAVCNELTARGADVNVAVPGNGFAADGAKRYAVRPAEWRDHELLVQTVNAGGALSGVVHLWNAGGTIASTGHVMEFHSLAALSRALLNEAPQAQLRMITVTSGAHSVLGEPVVVPERALSTGPFMVLPAEHLGVQGTLIDVETNNGTAWILPAASAIADEAAISDDADQFVAHRLGQRWSRSFASAALPAADTTALPLRDGGVYVVTGGLGGIGLTLSRWLARQSAARLVIISRSPFPDRAEWAEWLASHPSDDVTAVRIRDVQDIERTGGAVMVLHADVANRASMQRALHIAESEWGPVNAILHAAAIVGEGLMSLTNVEEGNAAIAAKVDGLHVLASVLGDRTLDFVALFSSINALGGSAGSYSYTAACAYQDAFAVSSKCPPSWPVFSIAWSVWRDVGMATREVVAPQFRATRAAMVAGGIRPDEGADAFARAMASKLPLLVVSPYDVTRAYQDRQRARAALLRVAPPIAVRTEGPANELRVEPLARVTSSQAVAAGAVEQHLIAVWEDLLGVNPIGVDENFFELGGHSLLATRVLARVDSHFGVRLSLRSIFEAPTVRQLAALISEDRAPNVVRDTATPTGDREEFEV